VLPPAGIFVVQAQAAVTQAFYQAFGTAPPCFALLGTGPTTRANR
jgi:hypothetical protein